MARGSAAAAAARNPSGRGARERGPGARGRENRARGHGRGAGGSSPARDQGGKGGHGQSPGGADGGVPSPKEPSPSPTATTPSTPSTPPSPSPTPPPFLGELSKVPTPAWLQFLRRSMQHIGGCFVEGNRLRNAFRWKETIGPWEERPGHYGDVWKYWTDDGLRYFEFLLLAEDLDAAPIYVFNAGISHHEEVNATLVDPFVKGNTESTWSSVRAAMGHPEPFPLTYVAIGNEDCEQQSYQGNYLKFFNAIREAYPDVKMISNCDGSSKPIGHPSDFYDFHIPHVLFHMKNYFDKTLRTGPKVFVSEYAAIAPKDGKGSLLVALAEAAFLTGLEKNSDIVQMTCYVPLFVNNNDRRWNPDAIVYNSWQSYGTPNYWVQKMFSESSGAMVHPITITSNYSHSLAASAITWKDTERSFLRVKIVNFGFHAVNLTLSAKGLEAGSVNAMNSKYTVLTSRNVTDENSFNSPTMVVPVIRELPDAGEEMQAFLAPHSFSSFDLALDR